MGNKKSVPSSCSSTGNEMCKPLEFGDGCEDISRGRWMCKCKAGYKLKANGKDSECIDVNECTEGLDDCRSKNSMCTNTKGSYTCGCGTYMELLNGKCVDINECLVSTGNCSQFSDCVNQEAAEPICECFKGYTGGGRPGVTCKDINECNSLPSVCESPAVCVNQPGTYKCECPPGYDPDSSGTACKTTEFCQTKQNDCDVHFADCELVPGSYICECKNGFIGNGKRGRCKPLPSNEGLPCELLGYKCNNYEKCVFESGVYECQELPAVQQFSTFVAEGGSANTPIWVWGVVVLGSVVLILLAAFVMRIVYRRYIKKPEDEEEVLYNDENQMHGYMGGQMGGQMGFAP